MHDEVFVAAARPKRLVRLISRYEPGITYGTHVDDALMEGSAPTSLRVPVNLDWAVRHRGGGQ